ncbi:hypothetical protein SAMN05446037_10141 [Anaerovirgula multivorans]|uniref:Uncharacterized protein n=1 Tax=Anaerovirgula multivorans TaxID=312168 RepID=A0A239FRK5_9FIRM|nr:hypothetical protein [Anaerovirgula multivorans]SNS59218.1 hypothetical protein SAMN05446037_10141 [Anaerovirgula multivorans]
MTKESNVVYDVSNKVGWIKLNRPQALNAWIVNIELDSFFKVMFFILFRT